MQADREITASGKSVQEARTQIEEQTPEGLSLLSEKVIRDGKAQVLSGRGDTVAEAFDNALMQKASHATEIERKTLSPPKTTTVTIAAFTEPDAMVQVSRLLTPHTRVRKISLKVPGRTGFAGIGKKPHSYEVEIIESATVEITVKSDAVVTATVGLPPLQKAVLIIPRFAAALDSLIPQTIERAHGYPKRAILETYLFALLMQQSGWLTYQICGVTRRHRPCSRVRWTQTPQAITIRCHRDYADGSQAENTVEIMRLAQDTYAFSDRHSPGTIEVGMVYMTLSGLGGSGHDPVQDFLDQRGIGNTVQEAIKRGIVDTALPAYVLIFKRGKAPANEPWYIDQIIDTLLPQVRSTADVQIRTHWEAGAIDQSVVAAALVHNFGGDVLDSEKYETLVEAFTDADGDGGSVATVFRRD